MDNKEIAKQTIDFHKSMFLNNYNAMVMFQDQTEKMFNTFLSQVNWVPQDIKKSMEKLIATYKKSRDEFKNSVNDNFKRLEDHLSAVDKPQTKTK